MRVILFAAAFALVFSPAFAQGPVTIGGVTYDHVDPGPAFTEAARPPQDWSAPAPFAAETAAGMMAYVTSDAGDYKPDRIPRADEHAAKLSAFFAQGQTEATWVGVSGLSDLQGLSATVDLKGAPVSVDVRHLHFWPQRTGWGSRQWYMTPEMLLPCAGGMQTVPATHGILVQKPFDLKLGETAAFWLTFIAADDAKPGVYQCAVTISSAGKPSLTLPLTVEVLPFKLDRPKSKQWLLYADTWRWNAMSDAQVLAELRDFGRHGITGLVEMPLGSEDLSQLKAGKVTFDARPFKRLAKLCDEAGIPGPHVCSYGGAAERVRDALGLTVDLGKGEWPQAVKDGVALVAKAAVDATKDTPTRWYYYGVDEPTGENTYAIQDYQAWHQGGAPTYATFGDPKFLEQAAAYLTAPCFVTYLISQEAGARAAREGCAKTGAEFWWYGIGSYVNPYAQEGATFANRYGAGFLLWKSGAKSAVAWTFQRVHEDVFNDFDGSQVNSAEPKDQMTAYPQFLRPDDWSTYQGAIPTLAWEGLREGVDDYRYLSTLASLITRAKYSSTRAAADAAKHAQDTLDTLTSTIPWVNPMVQSDFQTIRMQQVRRAIADQIVILQAALRGEALAPEAVREAHVSVLVSAAVADAAPESPMPAISAARAAVPPIIDGILDDACWASAPVADDFRTVNTDKPSAAPTEARLAYDDRCLYVAFDCHEPAMDKLVAKQFGHDTPMVWVDDGIEFFLGGADRKKYAHVIVNTNKSVYDEIGQDPSWNPALEVGLHKRADGYSVEIAIPWADLAQAGIARASIMTVNFCRSRFAGSDDSPHSSWSFAGGGFHVPERFGLAQFGDSALALSSVQVPRSWGRQVMVAELRNLSDAPVKARVGLSGSRAQQVVVPAHATATVRMPVDLMKPGPATASFSWGIAGKAPSTISFPITVPEPASVSGCPSFVSDGETVKVVVTTHATAADWQAYRVLATASTASGSQQVSFAAKPGRSARLQLRMSGPTTLTVGLVDDSGAWVGKPTQQRIIAFP